MKLSETISILCCAGAVCACTSKVKVVEAVSSTDGDFWKPVAAVQAAEADSVLVIDSEKTAQTIQGFGSCFNELGWTSLSELSEPDRNAIFQELFTPEGAGFTICRMPVAANDFARDYYSYAPVEDDFELEHFTIENDEETLIPFIKSALAVKPDLKIWGSPWCPPSWMKYNKHYANRAVTEEQVERFRIFNEQLTAAPSGPGAAGQGGQRRSAPAMSMRMTPVPNGLDEDKQIPEGKDSFIQDSVYFDTYARYFGKYIDAYKEKGIDIYMVMPQNEPNSAQPYPACTWTAEGINKFVKFLGPEMKKRGVELYLGTIERANPALADTVLNDPVSKTYITGAGFQWAGKNALPVIYKEHPELTFIQTEQECGNGVNDWAQAFHAWDLMTHYLGNGVSIYEYWNTSLLEGGTSRWGWNQNSLVTVNKVDKTYKYTSDYYMLKHVSHYVLPGAKYLELEGVKEAMAFVNPDGTVAVLLANKTMSPYTVDLQIGEESVKYEVPANSVNTILLDI